MELTTVLETITKMLRGEDPDWQTLTPAERESLLATVNGIGKAGWTNELISVFERMPRRACRECDALFFQKDLDLYNHCATCATALEDAETLQTDDLFDEEEDDGVNEWDKD